MDIPVSDKRNNNYRKITLSIFTLIKFALPVVFACLSTKLTQNPLFPIVMFIESLLVFLLTDLIAIKTPVTAYVIGVILLFVIYAQSVDAEGRNSLDLVPTILDYIDVDSPNFFLGSSLFLPMNNPELETVFCVPDYDWRVNTADGELSPLTDDELSYYNEVLERYLALTQIADVPS